MCLATKDRDEGHTQSRLDHHHPAMMGGIQNEIHNTRHMAVNHLGRTTGTLRTRAANII